MSENANLQKYELTFILGEKATQELATAKSDELKKLIEGLGGSIIKEDQWGRRELAYPIKRNRSGFYVTIVFELPARALKSFTQPLRFDESIIRSLVTKAYTTAQPGTLYPQAEETATEATAQPVEETASAEEMLRRSAAPKKDKAVVAEDVEEELPEEERMKKLDETLEELLKEEA